ncbi:dTDP-4-dehydrorhamnose reductase [Pseudooceanicola antarcticus]|uniref:dTDP-4-dehydrorhamnose reductase n=1 Tax=Pseudooceanicola antarcticus TaxID=1247613 RepID=A0A285IHN7_9RHOB|nr:dTDP-4-dehydrorhamnose reductase [Pseudooceanicola antarcticus]PJE28998.1 dTDP-4-dehydrorhamnose reductase [Pseudooceanicola antarcticus]SNY47297.1 dTDP-4-dehydrorhamnose reductase [Pseudooceanicola antarcticus]
MSEAQDQRPVLVFGRSGQLATELARRARVTCMGHEAADLVQPGAAARAIASVRPSMVINAAAYTAVDRAESEAALAQRINAAAPGEMAEACAEAAIPFLHVSSDYVLDGSGESPREESARPAPLNAYGATKLAGEEAIRAAGGHWAVLRCSWVFSAHGTNFVKTMLRLSESRDALTIVADQVGGPTPAADIAAALLEMGRQMAAGKRGGLYHYAGAPDVSWADFAREIFAQAGREVSVTDIPTEAYPTPAVRPLNSRLDCRRLEVDFGIARRDWRLGLRQVLEELGALA